jgi:hypothetical protein
MLLSSTVDVQTHPAVSYNISQWNATLSCALPIAATQRISSLARSRACREHIERAAQVGDRRSAVCFLNLPCLSSSGLQHSLGAEIVIAIKLK